MTQQPLSDEGREAVTAQQKFKSGRWRGELSATKKPHWRAA